MIEQQLIKIEDNISTIHISLMVALIGKDISVEYEMLFLHYDLLATIRDI